METKKEEVKYNVLFSSGFKEVTGKPIKEMEKYGRYCIHKEGKGAWMVDEYTSGRVICSERNPEYAIEKAIDLIKKHGIEKTKQLIEKSIKQYGAANG